jgi:RNA polymerase sigma-70 factor, ECF subfamily
LQERSNNSDASTVHRANEQAFERLVTELRPKLHRYCARMMGSVIDGEDVVQEVLLKALEALPRNELLANPEGWLFRIAHNTAVDFLRRRARHHATHLDDDIEMIAALDNATLDREIAAASLRTFMRLPMTQRSSVILRDVLGYSVNEICEFMAVSAPTIKASLQRGRENLRELAEEPEDRLAPSLAEAERARLMNYIDLFNARDFDALRDLLGDEVRLDLVNRARLKGRRSVGEYFHRYSENDLWHLVPGFVDRQAATLVFDKDDVTGPPVYFVILDWDGDSIVSIRDFLFARYAIEDAEVSRWL